MAKTKNEPIEGPEEVVLEDNQIICLLTGDIKASKPKEETLQSVIRMLNEEYGFDMKDMRRDFIITGYDPDTGKTKKQKIDLVLFEDSKGHEQENIIRLCIVQDEKVKETDPKNGLEFTLQNALNALDSCEFGLWTNGQTYHFLQKTEDDSEIWNLKIYLTSLEKGRRLKTSIGLIKVLRVSQPTIL